MNQSLCWGVGHSDPWDHLSQRARVGGWNHRIDSLMMLRRSGYHKEICKLNHTSATKSQKDLFWQTRQEKSVTRTLLVLSSETALHEAIMSSDPWYVPLDTLLIPSQWGLLTSEPSWGRESRHRTPHPRSCLNHHLFSKLLQLKGAWNPLIWSTKLFKMVQDQPLAGRHYSICKKHIKWRTIMQNIRRTLKTWQ